MRIVPERSPWAQLLTVFGAFLVGPYAALRLSTAVTPGSELVQTVAPFAFMLTFFFGTLLWSGWGILLVVGKGLLQMVRGRRPGIEGLGDRDRLVPPGYRIYPVLGAFSGASVGVLAALVSPLGFVVGVGIWAAAGTAYGALLSGAAHVGLLPFPEPE